MKEIDKNEDGKLTWEELFDSSGEPEDMPEDIKTQYKKVFDGEDKNSDGHIDMTELEGLFNALSKVELDDGDEPGKDEI